MKFFLFLTFINLTSLFILYNHHFQNCIIQHIQNLYYPYKNIDTMSFSDNSILNALQFLDNIQMLNLIKSFIPKLTSSLHKGQAGRIAVIGGCQEYTGAPYYSAISVLRIGCDLVHVFCTKDASTVIKSYSPELIVHPVIDTDNNVNLVNDWLDRMHAVVLGPGLGRDYSLTKFIPKILTLIIERNLPLIIDADGLWMVTPHLEIIIGYKNAILTPNIVEFSRLYKHLFNIELSEDTTTEIVEKVSRQLKNVTILVKGEKDIISDGTNSVYVNDYGSSRRCGGQGDILSGSVGAFSAWAHIALTNHDSTSAYSGQMAAAYAGSLLVRHCAYSAFKIHGRSMITTDMIQQIGPSFHKLFELD